MNIVVIGTVFVDIKGFPTGEFIPLGRNAGTIEEVHGGVGRNIAVDMANLGVDTTFIGLVDESGAGAQVISELAEMGVCTDYMKVTPDGMGTWMAIFDDTGDVFANLSKRPNLLPMVDILNEHHEEIFSKADSICLEIDIDEEVVERVLFYAKQYQVPVYTVISNMTIAMERRPFINETECFFCNQQEAGIFWNGNYETSTPAELKKILAEKMAQDPLRSMVITMGSQGAVYVDADGNSGFCPPQKADVKDTTGAGDAFFAGTSAGLTAKKSMVDACDIGSKLAAAVISSTENVGKISLCEDLKL